MTLHKLEALSADKKSGSFGKAKEVSDDKQKI